MLEKTGTVVLTQDDIKQVKKGIVSDRVKQSWGLTIEEAKAIVDSGSYTTTDGETSGPDQGN